MGGGGIYMFVTLCQGLILLALDSNLCDSTALNAAFPSDRVTFSETCSMGIGAKCTIAATVESQTHNVTYTKITGADGTEAVAQNVVKGEPIPIRGGNETLTPLMSSSGTINV